MTAARTGKVDAVKVLLAQGANANAKEGWRGTTALMWAAAEGHAGAALALIAGGNDKGADIHARSNGGLTPILFAVREGNIEAARVLLAAGANVNDAAPDGTSALVLSIINAHFELGALLLDKGADPNAADPRGSALHALAWMRRPGRAPGAVAQPVPTGSLDSLALAKALLAHGANPNVRLAWKESKKAGFQLGTEVDLPPNIAIGRNYLIFLGATPFYLAAKSSDVNLMRVLAANGADPLIPTLQNVTPLMAAAGIGFWQGESPGPNNGVPESDTLEAVKLAFDLGGDVHAVTDFGDTPLEGDGVTLLHSLPLNRAQFPDQGDMRWGGSTALHGAALRGVNGVVQFLLDKGAKLDVKNNLGWTPLMLTQGMYIGQTEKEQPHTEAFIRQLTGSDIVRR
jgi:ankyrin repeat protein